MIAVPISFVLAAFLLTLLARLQFIHGSRQFGGIKAVLFVAALLAILTGLRWTMDAPILRFLQPLVGSTFPPLVWISMSALWDSGRRSRAQSLVHAIPTLLVVLLLIGPAALRSLLDVVLISQYLGYGVRLAAIALAGQDRLSLARLNDVRQARTAMFWAAAILILSAVSDLAIVIDFAVFRGAHASTIVMTLTVALMAAVAVATVVAGTAVIGLPADRAEVDPADNGRTLPDIDQIALDQSVLEKLSALLDTAELYRDPNLTLTRLARKAGIPARQISAAINRSLGCNVSQYVNRRRVAVACHLLKTTDQPVTDIMFDCGFQTKSNFNREFKRVIGLSPSDYRRSG